MIIEAAALQKFELGNNAFSLVLKTQEDTTLIVLNCCFFLYIDIDLIMHITLDTNNKQIASHENQENMYLTSFTGKPRTEKVISLLTNGAATMIIQANPTLSLTHNTNSHMKRYQTKNIMK